MFPPHIITGSVALTVTVLTTLFAVIPQEVYDAVAGLIVALTVLVHLVITEKTRRQASRIRPRVRHNERRIGKAEGDLRDAIVTRDQAIERLNHRVESLTHIIEQMADKE